MKQPDTPHTFIDNFVRWFSRFRLLRPLVDLFFRYREIFMYLIFGVLTTAVDWLVYFPFYNIFHVDPLLSNLFAWIAAVLFAYFTNKGLVFQSQTRGFSAALREFAAFTGGRVLSFLVQEGLLFLTVHLLRMNANLSKIGVSVVVIILNYFFSKLLVFRSRKS